MGLSLDTWYLLPAAIAIATIAMAGGIGGVFLGMISVGLTKLQECHLVARCRLPSPVAVAMAIFAFVVTVLLASLDHF